MVVAVAAVLYAAALYLFVQSTSGEHDTSADPASTATASTGASAAEPTAPPTFGSGTADVTGPNATTTRSFPGTTITANEPGGIAILPPSRHTIVLRVESAGTIMRLGYLVPTSQDHPSGDLRNVDAPWSLTTTAYGKPAYAEIFLQTDRSGTPITCTVTVDGKAVSTRTAKGIYAQTVCIG